MTTLLIVESPAKCKKIEEYLGDKYKCIASFGHIQELKDLKQINLSTDFEPKYKPIAFKKKNIQILQSFAKRANEVILATDDDREGEAIAWHICQICNLPVETTKRIVFHEITKTALERSLENVRTIDMKVVKAQQARQILDLIVGFKISPILWQYVQQKLSAGRCQTPALKIIYENYDKIQKEETNFLYTTTGYFTNKSIPFKLNYEYDDISLFLESCKTFPFKFSRTPPSQVTKSPPQPLITSTLQQKANNLYNMSPKETMNLAQKLYEGGYITYMRTDSTVYSKDFIKTQKRFIETKWGHQYVNEKINNLSQNKKKTNSQEAHEAIRPTNIQLIAIPNENQTRLQKLYQLIYNTTLESGMAPAKYYKLVSSISSPEEHFFIYTCESPIFLGWKIVQNKDDSQTEIYNYLLNLPETQIKYQKITSDQVLKKKTFHYNEAQLVNLLEKKEIGRPSTFSSIVEKIKDRGYVIKTDIPGIEKEYYCFELQCNVIQKNLKTKSFGEEKNKLVIQTVGIKAVQFLYQYYEELFDYEYTKQMEEQLDEIVSKNKVWNEICRDNLDKINKLTKDIDIKKPESKSRLLGKHEDSDVLLKEGPYGIYVSWKKNNIQIKGQELDINKTTLEDILPYLEEKIMKRLNEELMVRKSQYGYYIYYKTKKMKKPKFLNLNKFTEDPMECDKSILIEWIKKTYKI